MNDLSKFDDIRCYHDEEIGAVFQRITKDQVFHKVIQYLFPDVPTELMMQQLVAMKSIEEFQLKMIYPFLKRIEDTASQGIKIDGIENIKDYASCLHISNHRDIVLDSALLCKCLIENDLKTVEIAIGDNLLIYPWITDLVRANKSFIVKRGGGVREMLTNSQRLSAYISHTLQTKAQSIWLAQREGRCKDSNDRTQESLLKMLNMGGESKNFLDNMQSLNLCPVSISYEYDPCDYLKAKEFQQKRDDAAYKKSPADDLINMQTGIMGHKGRITFRFMSSINDSIKAIETDNKNEQIARVASLIDQSIHSGYELYSGNLVAYDLLFGTDTFTQEYTNEEKITFENYLQTQLNKIELENKDEAFLRERILEMYANPTKNWLATQ